jgi:hypothetical protein
MRTVRLGISPLRRVAPAFSSRTNHDEGARGIVADFTVFRSGPPAISHRSPNMRDQWHSHLGLNRKGCSISALRTLTNDESAGGLGLDAPRNFTEGATGPSHLGTGEAANLNWQQEVRGLAGSVPQERRCGSKSNRSGAAGHSGAAPLSPFAQNYPPSAHNG